MKHEAIIDCPKSGGDLCYKVEVTPEITNYFSMSCCNSTCYCSSNIY